MTPDPSDDTAFPVDLVTYSERVAYLRGRAAALQAEPAAWLLSGGRLFADAACVDKEQADERAESRDDGSRVSPLYRAAS